MMTRMISFCGVRKSAMGHGWGKKLPQDNSEYPISPSALEARLCLTHVDAK